MKAWNWPETSCNPTVCVCCLSPVCRLLQVFKREIRESGWVRLTDVSSGEPVWVQQEPQLSSSSPSARLWPRSAAPVIVSSRSCSPFPRHFAPPCSSLYSPSVCALLSRLSPTPFSVKSLPWFPLISDVSITCLDLILTLFFWCCSSVLFWCGRLCFFPAHGILCNLKLPCCCCCA